MLKSIAVVRRLLKEQLNIETGIATIEVPLVIEKLVISPILPFGRIVNSPEIGFSRRFRCTNNC
jgi:hypothetical protein